MKKCNITYFYIGNIANPVQVFSTRRFKNSEMHAQLTESNDPFSQTKSIQEN